MKRFALVIAFALLTAVPAFAAEISKTAPAMTPVKQTREAAPRSAWFLDPVPRCYTLDGHSCQASGATQGCTDVCNNDLSCTCRDFYYNSTYLGSYWVCDYEC